MKIDCGKYVLCSDPMNIWIEKKTKRGTVKVAGYDSTLNLVLKDLVKKRIRGSEADDIKALINELTAIETDLLELADRIGAELGVRVCGKNKE